MKRCARCNKEGSVLEQRLSLDRELCDECLFDIDEKIRERRIITIRRLKDDNEGELQLNMKNGIDVSVIIPIYNAAETSASLATKTLSEPHLAIELIIVDDGSTDETDNAPRQIHNDRLILIEQANQGVYAVRNIALALRQEEQVIFLNMDDDIADGFIEKGWQVVSTSQVDVMILNGWHSCVDQHRGAVRKKQPYGTSLSGYQWIRHCVTHYEWLHYPWLQMVGPPYVRQYSLRFQSGRSHKDIF